MHTSEQNGLDDVVQTRMSALLYSAMFRSVVGWAIFFMHTLRCLFLTQQVGCEGYDYPDDPFILKGSCQLIYSLKTPSEYPTWDGGDAWRSRGAETEGRNLGNRLATWAVLGVIGYILYNILQRANERPARKWNGTVGVTPRNDRAMRRFLYCFDR